MTESLMDAGNKQLLLDLLGQFVVPTMWLLTRVCLILAQIATSIMDVLESWFTQTWLRRFVSHVLSDWYLLVLQIGLGLAVITLALYSVGIRTRWVRASAIIRWPIILLVLAQTALPLYGLMERVVATLSGRVIALTGLPDLALTQLAVTANGTTYRLFDPSDAASLAANQPWHSHLAASGADGHYAPADLSMALWSTQPAEIFGPAPSITLPTESGSLSVAALPPDFQAQFFAVTTSLASGALSEPAGSQQRAAALARGWQGMLMGAGGLLAALVALAVVLLGLLLRVAALLLLLSVLLLAPLGIFGTQSVWVGLLIKHWFSLTLWRVGLLLLSQLVLALLYGTAAAPGIVLMWPLTLVVLLLVLWMHVRLLRQGWRVLGWAFQPLRVAVAARRAAPSAAAEITQQAQTSAQLDADGLTAVQPRPVVETGWEAAHSLHGGAVTSALGAAGGGFGLVGLVSADMHAAEATQTAQHPVQTPAANTPTLSTALPIYDEQQPSLNAAPISPTLHRGGAEHDVVHTHAPVQVRSTRTSQRLDAHAAAGQPSAATSALHQTAEQHAAHVPLDAETAATLFAHADAGQPSAATVSSQTAEQHAAHVPLDAETARLTAAPLSHAEDLPPAEQVPADAVGTMSSHIADRALAARATEPLAQIDHQSASRLAAGAVVAHVDARLRGGLDAADATLLHAAAAGEGELEHALQVQARAIHTTLGGDAYALPSANQFAPTVDLPYALHTAAHTASSSPRRAPLAPTAPTIAAAAASAAESHPIQFDQQASHSLLNAAAALSTPAAADAGQAESDTAQADQIQDTAHPLLNAAAALSAPAAADAGQADSDTAQADQAQDSAHSLLNAAAVLSAPGAADAAQADSDTAQADQAQDSAHPLINVANAADNNPAAAASGDPPSAELDTAAACADALPQFLAPPLPSTVLSDAPIAIPATASAATNLHAAATAATRTTAKGADAESAAYLAHRSAIDPTQKEKL